MIIAQDRTGGVINTVATTSWTNQNRTNLLYNTLQPNQHVSLSISFSISISNLLPSISVSLNISLDWPYVMFYESQARAMRNYMRIRASI